MAKSNETRSVVEPKKVEERKPEIQTKSVPIPLVQTPMVPIGIPPAQLMYR